MPPDITIQIGSYEQQAKFNQARRFAGGKIRWSEQTFNLTHPSVGDMFVVSNKIYWQPSKQEDIKGFRTFLVNTLLPAYAILQGMLPLHISAVSIAGHAIAFQGMSGAGKSTLAAMLMLRGYNVLTDDLGIVELDSKQAIIRPGLPHFRLWEQSFEHLNEQPIRTNLAWSRQGKYYRAIKDSEFCEHSQPLAAIYFLKESQEDSETNIVPLSGFSAANALMHSRFFGIPQNSESQTTLAFNETMQLARLVPCFNLIRQKDFELADQVIDSLIEHWQTFLPL